MSLDLNKVAGQVEEMVHQLRDSIVVQRENLAVALEIMNRESDDPNALKEKIQKSKTSWLVAGLVDGLNKRYPAGPLPSNYTVLATDGSHIEVDRHRTTRCYLLNISHVVLRYGDDPDANLESIPRLYANRDELVIAPPDGTARGQIVEGTLLGARRSIEECRHLADLTAQLTSGSTALALLDGTLMLWGLEPYPDFVTDILLEKGLLKEFDHIRSVCHKNEINLSFASYISAPRSTDVVNALRIAICPHEVPNCDTFCKSSRYDCEVMAELNDNQLFSMLLGHGERSAAFVSRSKIIRDRYGEHEIYFFYLRVDDEIARIEIPKWIAQDENLLELTHSLVLDQCNRGDGYPVALSEAHEQAVVTLTDRENFWQLVEASLVEEKLPTPTTGKSRSKRTRWV